MYFGAFLFKIPRDISKKCVKMLIKRLPKHWQNSSTRNKSRRIDIARAACMTKNMYLCFLLSLQDVRKSQKKVSFNIVSEWVDKSWLIMPKMVHFGEFLKTWSLRSNSITRHVNFKQDKNWWKIPKFNFLVIFKHCESALVVLSCKGAF